MHGEAHVNQSHGITGLLPGSFRHELPREETPEAANMFIRQYLEQNGIYLVGFRVEGWVHPTNSRAWWTKLTTHVVARFGQRLEDLNFMVPVLAMKNGTLYSPPHLFGILERHCPQCCTFYTPIGEMGIAIREMFKVSMLPYGEFSYEEYIPTIKKLDELKGGFSINI